MVEQTKDKNFSSQLNFQSILKMVRVSNGKHHFLLYTKEIIHINIYHVFTNSVILVCLTYN